MLAAGIVAAGVVVGMSPLQQIKEQHTPKRSHTLVCEKGVITWNAPQHDGDEPAGELRIFSEGEQHGRASLARLPVQFEAESGVYGMHTPKVRFAFHVSTEEEDLPLATTLSGDPVLVENGIVSGCILKDDLKPVYTEVVVHQNGNQHTCFTDYESGCFQMQGCAPGPAYLSADCTYGHLECPIVITDDPSIGLPFEGALMCRRDAEMCEEECGPTSYGGGGGGFAGGGGGAAGGGGGGLGGGEGLGALLGLGALGLTALGGDDDDKGKDKTPSVPTTPMMKPMRPASPSHP